MLMKFLVLVLLYFFLKLFSVSYTCLFLYTSTLSFFNTFTQFLYVPGVIGNLNNNLRDIKIRKNNYKQFYNAKIQKTQKLEKIEKTKTKKIEVCKALKIWKI